MTRVRCATYALTAAALISSGCADYRWDQNIERAEQRAKAENKYLFVYCWRGFDNDCNRMFADVINQPDVVKLFQNTVNSQVCYDVRTQREYMARHGTDRAPAFLIQAPDGAYQKLTGYVSKEVFIKWAQTAMTKTSERPNKPPPVTPQRVP